jgi:hypothetical protein
MERWMSKRPAESERADGAEDPIAAYAQALPHAFRMTCDLLRELIDGTLAKGTSRIWHGGPVWFIDENPVVGYSATAKAVNLLFWNGQAFDETELRPIGKYRAAQASFKKPADIDPGRIRGWLEKAGTDVFDSNAFFKNVRQARKANE